MYRVIKYFTDLQDNDHAYQVGDVFPRPGMDVSEKRLAELASAENKQRVPLIEEVKEAKSEPVADVTDEETADDEPLEDETPDVDRKPKRKKRGE